MNTKLKQELANASKEIEEATIELSAAFQDYERRRKAAQKRLSFASAKLSAINSLVESSGKQ